jgi:hypothetical protein
MKRYLLIAGSRYYPAPYTGDWIGCYATEGEARDRLIIEQEDILFDRGPRKGQVKETVKRTYALKDNGDRREFDWWDIVDLEKWVST